MLEVGKLEEKAGQELEVEERCESGLTGGEWAFCPLRLKKDFSLTALRKANIETERF